MWLLVYPYGYGRGSEHLADRWFFNYGIVDRVAFDGIHGHTNTPDGLLLLVYCGSIEEQTYSTTFTPFPQRTPRRKVTQSLDFLLAQILMLLNLSLEPSPLPLLILLHTHLMER